jgi:hypothetical protein
MTFIASAFIFCMTQARMSQMPRLQREAPLIKLRKPSRVHFKVKTNHGATSDWNTAM